MSDSPPGVGHTDSIESNESNGKQQEKRKSRRPASEWKSRNVGLRPSEDRGREILGVRNCRNETALT
jgi:hypothetical protein